MGISYYKGNIPIINDDPDSMAVAFPGQVRNGYIERDYRLYPEEMFAQPTDMQVIPESEYDARYDEQEALKSSLEHVYLSGPGGAPAFVNLDQNGDGYCWMYSNGAAAMLMRLLQGLPMVRLNPHSAAAIVKNGRDEGGWCGLGAKFLREVGMAAEGASPGQWPLHSRSLSHDTPQCRAEMAKHRVTEDYVDLTKKEYDQNMTHLQIGTCLFSNIPVPSDHNWWGHSICKIRRVRIEKGSWGDLILNSWKGWGRHGLGVIQGSKMTSNGAVAVRSVVPSIV